VPTVNDLLLQYDKLMRDIDGKVERVHASAPDIPCGNKCYDCCEQLFPITFIEAWALSNGIETLPRALRRERKRAAEEQRAKILERSPEALQKTSVERTAALRTHAEFARLLHGITASCPALDPNRAEGSCTVYEFRNHDCRTMGASFDMGQREVVGCFRFNNLKHIIPNLMSFNYRYDEKQELDQALIAAATDNAFPPIIYLGTMCTPFLTEFKTTDWTTFFQEKGVPRKNTLSEEESQNYWVVIDA